MDSLLLGGETEWGVNHVEIISLYPPPPSKKEPRRPEGNAGTHNNTHADTDTHTHTREHPHLTKERLPYSWGFHVPGLLDFRAGISIGKVWARLCSPQPCCFSRILLRPGNVPWGAKKKEKISRAAIRVDGNSVPNFIALGFNNCSNGLIELLFPANRILMGELQFSRFRLESKISLWC